MAKGPNGYGVVDLEKSSPQLKRELMQLFHRSVTRVDCGGSMVILGTENGAASEVARQIDAAGLPQVLGTIAGTDTVFVSARSSGQALDLRWQFRKIAGRK